MDGSQPLGLIEPADAAHAPAAEAAEPGRPPSAESAFGRWLRARRRALDLTQEELADRVGYSFETVRKIEAGLLRPSKASAERLAGALDVPPDRWPAFVQFARAVPLPPPAVLPTGGAAPTTVDSGWRPGAAPVAAPAPASSPTAARRLLAAVPGPLIGREPLVDAARRQLARPDVRLLSLVGTAGVGKTRLAIEVASAVGEEFPDGVCLIDLTPVADPGLVVGAIARALGVPDVGGRPLLETLQLFLGSKRLLLILDSFEHVLTAAQELATLLAACPDVKTLVTSRAALRLPWEHQLPIPPLALPDPERTPEPDALGRVAAVALFMHRARAVAPEFALTAENARTVAEICRRLDGLPLALELAASRVRFLPPSAMLAHLPYRLPSREAPGRPARHQTLRGAIAWSYDLLDPAEQALFRRLAVFAGGFTLESAEAVCAAHGHDPIGETDLDLLDGLESLCDKSLVRQEAIDDQPRFSMLETIRAFAQERLAESGQAEAARRRHAAHFAAFAEALEPDLTGARQAQALERLAREHENLRRAVRFAVDARHSELGLRLGAALWRFWWIRGHLAEGVDALSAVLALPHGGAGGPDRGRALFGAGILAYSQGDMVDAQRRFEDASEAGRASGDQGRLAYGLHGLGTVAQFRGEHDTARGLVEESLALFRTADDRWGTASALLLLGHASRSQGDSEAARRLYDESLAIWRASGDQRGTAEALLALGHAAMSQSDYPRARALYEESLAIQRTLGDLDGMADTLPGLARIATAEADYARARRLCEEGLEVSRALGDRDGCAEALLGLGRIAVSQGDHAAAHRFLTESLAIWREVRSRRAEAEVLIQLARLALAEGGFTLAQQRGEEALAVLRELAEPRAIAWVRVLLGSVARCQGDRRLARALLEESLLLFRDTATKAGVGAALLNLAALERDGGEASPAAAHFLEALATFQEVGRVRDAAACLVAASRLLVPTRPAEAARLTAAGAAQHERIGAAMDAPTSDDHVETTRRARAALGDDAFAAAWSAGQALSLEQAVSQVRAVLADL